MSESSAATKPIIAETGSLVPWQPVKYGKRPVKA